MTIEAIHGIVENYNNQYHTHKHYIDFDFLDWYLGKIPKFSKWDRGRSNRDVLTVDDATYAGANACILARKYGHEVILFINPFQIIEQQPYFFSIINCLIDQRRIEEITYEGFYFNLEIPMQLNDFRYFLKRKLMRLSENFVYKELNDLRILMGVSQLEIPHHLRPLNAKDITKLQNLGVTIGSHGWSHQDIGSLSESDLIKDISNSKKWIENLLSIECNFYAPPFGDTEVNDNISNLLMTDYFLACEQKPLGKLKDNCWNRRKSTSLWNEIYVTNLPQKAL